MKLLSSDASLLLSSKQGPPKEPGNWSKCKPTLSSTDRRSDQIERAFAKRMTVPSMVEWISQIHKFEVEANHQRSNLKFRKSLSSILQYPHPINGSNLKAPVANVKIIALDKGTKLKELSIWKKPTYCVEDLDFILCQTKKVLIASRLLKRSFAREISIPGIYLTNDHPSSRGEPLALKDENPDNIYLLCSSSKEASLSIQSYISECSQDDLEILVGKLNPRFPDMITHNFGSFVLQRLMLIHEASFVFILKFSKEHFGDLVKNEYSSRVMQLLVEKSKEFCDFSIDIFRTKLAIGIESSSSCHILVACLKNQTNKSEGDFLVDHLRQKSGLISNRYFHRALLTYVHVGTQEQRDRVAEILGVASKLPSLFNRKATAVLVITLIHKNHKPTIACMCGQLCANPFSLFASRYFTTSIDSLTRGTSIDLQSEVFAALLTFPANLLHKISKNGDHLCQYLFLLLSCCNDAQKTLFANFIEESRLSFPLKEIIGLPIDTTQGPQPARLEYHH